MAVVPGGAEGGGNYAGARPGCLRGSGARPWDCYRGGSGILKSAVLEGFLPIFHCFGAITGRTSVAEVGLSSFVSVVIRTARVRRLLEKFELLGLM